MNVGRLAPSFVRQLLLPLVLSGRIEGFLGRDDLCWLLSSSVRKNGLSGDSDGGYLIVLEDRDPLVEKFNSHRVCLSS